MRLTFRAVNAVDCCLVSKQNRTKHCSRFLCDRKPCCSGICVLLGGTHLCITFGPSPGFSGWSINRWHQRDNRWGAVLYLENWQQSQHLTCVRLSVCLFVCPSVFLYMSMYCKCTVNFVLNALLLYCAVSYCYVLCVYVVCVHWIRILLLLLSVTVCLCVSVCV